MSASINTVFEPTQRGGTEESRGHGASVYEPFNFRAFCLHKGRSSADSAARVWRGALGRAPEVTLESASWTVHVETGGGTTVGWDPDGRVAVVLHGEIHDEFGETAEALARRYRIRGRRLPHDLNGSFAILVLDRESDRVLVATDRVRSRRVFHSFADGGHWLTSDLGHQPTAGRPLDVTGIAWYVAGGTFYNGRTPFEGIRVLDPGTCFALDESALTPQRYWSHVVREPEGDVDLDLLADDLGERLVEAVRRRASGDLILSLSGGYDSTAIAVILSEVLGITDVRTFSYVSRREYGKIKDFDACADGQKDAFVAARTAQSLGLPHRIVETYRGDLMAHLRRNAEWTQGMARGWSAADVWTMLDDELAGAHDPVVMVGDEYFGLAGTDDLASVQAVWHDVHIRDLAFPPPVEDAFPRDLADRMRRGLARDRAEILERQEHHGDLFRMQDHLVHEQRNVHVILPWRELYAGRFGKVRTPLLDSEVLDLVTAVPHQARRGKSLFLEAMRRLSPTFRDFVRSKREGYHPDFGPLVRAESSALGAWIDSSRSRLDEVIPVAFGRKLLDSITDPPGRWSVPRLGTAARRRARKTLRRQRTRRALGTVSLFRCWAVLRMVLED